MPKDIKRREKRQKKRLEPGFMAPCRFEGENFDWPSIKPEGIHAFFNILLELQSQFYQIHLPLKEKPIGLIKSKYQKRTLRKRAFKKEITNRSYESLQTYLFAHDVGKPSVGASAPLVPMLNDSLAFDHRELDSLAA